MKHDDWKLTAYALGELEGEDRVPVAKEVAESADLQREIDAIRAYAGRLSGALAQGETLDATAAPSTLRSRSRIGTLRASVAIAATIALSAGAYHVFVPDSGKVSDLPYCGPAAPSEPTAIAENFSPTVNSEVEIVNSPTHRNIRELAHDRGERRSTGRGAGSALNRPQGPIAQDYELVASSAGGGVAGELWMRDAEEYGIPEVQLSRNFFNPSTATASTGSGASSWIVLDHINPVDLATLTEGDREFLRSIGYMPNDPSSAERYAPIVENPFRLVDTEPLSTFSIDVDTASYANIRRFLTADQLPPPDAVRIEEMINYFDYDYPQPVDEHPFSVNLEIADCPWNAQHRLARIGTKGYELDPRERPAANLVFLIDVSGSMNTAGKLPLVQESLGLLIDQLDRRDSIAMVVYAGASGVVLEPTGGTHRELIRNAVYRLQAGGSTNGGAGIEAAYNLASENFIEGGVNRVILATDGDFNVGVTGQGELQRLIEERAKSGVFLTVLGFGMGNLQDATLETLADKGNGNYAYIDTLNEARKVLVEQMGGTLVTIAKDVKIQVEFNPLAVSAYRLIGYENRMLAAQDFNDDRKDAGEIGAGHTVTALYEIVPAGQQIDVPAVDDLKYQRLAETTPAAESGEMMTVKLRYKEPDGAVSKLIEVPVTDAGTTFVQSSDDFAFAAAVASFGMLLRGSSHAATLDYTAVAEMAQDSLGDDFYGYRAEFLSLVRVAEQISRRTSPDGFTPVPAGSP